ncbi:MAG: hypothetical protein ACE5GZ_14025, partial [Gammaproteobacteria bacterium]
MSTPAGFYHKGVGINFRDFNNPKLRAEDIGTFAKNAVEQQRKYEAQQAAIKRYDQELRQQHGATGGFQSLMSPQQRIAEATNGRTIFGMRVGGRPLPDYVLATGITGVSPSFGGATPHFTGEVKSSPVGTDLIRAGITDFDPTNKDHVIAAATSIDNNSNIAQAKRKSHKGGFGLVTKAFKNLAPVLLPAAGSIALGTLTKVGGLLSGVVSNSGTPLLSTVFNVANAVKSVSPGITGKSPFSGGAAKNAIQPSGNTLINQGSAPLPQANQINPPVTNNGIA